ncbi:MAG: hypothetical protein AAFZ52_18115, partial [Bacteroidota bacterium]
FYSNAADRAGTRVTDTLEATNSFRDSLDLRSLGDTVYYRVVALDERENVGEFSRPYALVLPDILPPAPPRLREFRADTNGVYFTWAPSSSDDVVNYQLERRARGTAYWELAASLPPIQEVGTYLDASGRDDLVYEYRLIARDEVGLRGVSNVLVAQRLPPPVMPAVSDLSVRPLPAESRIEIRWSYPSDGRLLAFKLLRAGPEGTLTTYRTLDVATLERRDARRPGGATQWRFSDQDLRRDREYRYAVQPVFRSGHLGRLAPPITVAY